ncbi:MAG: Crp/Fnr family transcriptional regulator [Pseudomonadota bacterium]
MSRTQQSLSDLPLFKDAEADVLRRFEHQMFWKTADEGELVLDFEDESSDVFFIAQGAVRVVVRTPGGREIIFGDLHDGEFFGEMAAIDDQPRSANVTALYKTRIGTMRAQAFLNLVFSSRTISHRLMRILTERIRGGNARMLELAVLPIKLRLYRDLLRQGRPRGTSGDLVISPPPFQHEIAARIGARREAVSRELSQLAKDGAIEKTRRSIVIKAPDELENAIRLFLESDD